MEKEKIKSFKFSPDHKNLLSFVSIKDWTTKDYNKNAIAYFLIGWIASTYGKIIILQIVGDILIITGIVLEIIYWYKKIKEKKPIKKSDSRVIENHEEPQHKQKEIVLNIILKVGNILKRIVHFIKNNYKIILIIFGVVGAFYWYEIRPSLIKKSCYSESRDKAIEKSKTESSDDNSFYADDYNTYYKWCLESKGL